MVLWLPILCPGRRVSDKKPQSYIWIFVVLPSYLRAVWPPRLRASLVQLAFFPVRIILSCFLTITMRTNLALYSEHVCTTSIRDVARCQERRHEETCLEHILWCGLWSFDLVLAPCTQPSKNLNPQQTQTITILATVGAGCHFVTLHISDGHGTLIWQRAGQSSEKGNACRFWPWKPCWPVSHRNVMKNSSSCLCWGTSYEQMLACPKPKSLTAVRTLQQSTGHCTCHDGHLSWLMYNMMNKGKSSKTWLMWHDPSTKIMRASLPHRYKVWSPSYAPQFTLWKRASKQRWTPEPEWHLFLEPKPLHTSTSKTSCHVFDSHCLLVVILNQAWPEGRFTYMSWLQHILMQHMSCAFQQFPDKRMWTLHRYVLLRKVALANHIIT